MDSEKIAIKLTGLRGEKSREQVAKDLGISVSAVAMYETGARIPRDEIKKKNCRLLSSFCRVYFF